VATAGPDLESVLAARGAGADAQARDTGRTFLHMDIGGGTSNLSLIRDGKIVQTGCLNVGGRLLKFEKSGKVTYVSPVLAGLTDLRPGDYPAEGQVEAVAQLLTHGLEMAAGLRQPTALMETLMTKEVGAPWKIPAEPVTVSFSGGVADCIGKDLPSRIYGDMGTELGAEIGKSLLCQGEFVLGQETIRATVIGAGCHSAQLSGSTVFVRDVPLPLKNLPVAAFSEKEQERADLAGLIGERLALSDEKRVVLALPGYRAPTYSQVRSLAEKLHAALQNREVLVCLESDMAKALGQCLSLMGHSRCLCIDRVRLEEGSFLDIGAPVGPALPVVIKTLILAQ